MGLGVGEGLAVGLGLAVGEGVGRVGSPGPVGAVGPKPTRGGTSGAPMLPWQPSEAPEASARVRPRSLRPFIRLCTLQHRLRARVLTGYTTFGRFWGLSTPLGGDSRLRLGPAPTPLYGAPVIDLEHARRIALEAVTRAGEAELAYWRAGREGLGVETKSDDSPVTIADREGEAIIKRIVLGAFPDHGFHGEETGQSAGAEYTWVVDPIDGTRGFVRGGKFWGPLVALVSGGRALVGAMALPALGDVYVAARGLGTTKNGAPVRVSQVSAWKDATLSLGEMQHLFKRRELGGLLSLVTSAASSRGYGDLAGCAMLLDGRADAWIEAGVQLWDLAPLQVLVEEAGGTFTDLSGASTITSGNAVATNGLLHQHVLGALV